MYIYMYVYVHQSEYDRLQILTYSALAAFYMHVHNNMYMNAVNSMVCLMRVFLIPPPLKLPFQ